MFKRKSPFVVDQKGNFWFWLAVIPALLLALSFRLIFSEARIGSELRKAFVKLEPELKIQFSGARLSLKEGVFYPQIAIQVYDLSGSYFPHFITERPLRFEVDEIKAPIKIMELISGRLSLNLVELGNIELSLDQSLFDLVTSPAERPDLQTITQRQIKIPQANSPEPKYKLEVPRPVERVKIRSVRFGGAWGSKFGLELKNVDLSLDKEGRAQLDAQLGFSFDKWGNQPSIPLFIRWTPEDRFISSTLAGRWKEGQINVSIMVDPTQDFFSVEGILRSLPMSTFLPFISQIIKPNSNWTDNFMWPDLLTSEVSGWGSFDFGVTGYLVQEKPALFSLRNLIIEDGNQKIEVGRYSQTLDLDAQSNEPFLVSFQEVEFSKLKALFGLAGLESFPIAMNHAVYSGAMKVISNGNYVSENIELKSEVAKLGALNLTFDKGLMSIQVNQDRLDSEVQLSGLKFFKKDRAVAQSSQGVIEYSYDKNKALPAQYIFTLEEAVSNNVRFKNLTIDLLKREFTAETWSGNEGLWAPQSPPPLNIKKAHDLTFQFTKGKWVGDFKFFLGRKQHHDALLVSDGLMSSPDTLRGKLKLPRISSAINDMEVEILVWPIGLFLNL